MVQIEMLERGRSGLAWGGRRPGTILDCDAGTGETYVTQGKARYVTPPAAAGVELMVPQRAAAERMRRKRG